jgi:hypothetical protein
MHHQLLTTHVRGHDAANHRPHGLGVWQTHHVLVVRRILDLVQSMQNHRTHDGDREKDNHDLQLFFCRILIREFVCALISHLFLLSILLCNLFDKSLQRI